MYLSPDSPHYLFISEELFKKSHFISLQFLVADIYAWLAVNLSVSDGAVWSKIIINPLSHITSHSPGFRLHLLRQETTVILLSAPRYPDAVRCVSISVPDRGFRPIPAVFSNPWHARTFKPRRPPCLLTIPTANGFDSPYSFARHVALFHAVFHRGILPRIGIVSCSIFSY